ncbi:MAG TPA: tRNA (adenosine(37)-N6)-threonylcarbamoyltransferase complex ATPase subunit type 1 TsaE [Alcanivoracaceae bacterium]|nr:tRNA (adenosine(37)-N6)-threonylcarbamoyltransferase complex ATPase subunit type 1 TsaE [Alcanivoracaceae bacterium]
MGEKIIQLGADEQHTIALGAALANTVPFGSVVYLTGQLGAGKTTLVRGWLQALGHTGAVKSPTYTLVEPYEYQGKELYHFDLYRLGDAEELEYMGIRDYFHEHSLCFIEWPERGAGILPSADLHIELDVKADSREARLTGPLVATLQGV